MPAPIVVSEVECACNPHYNEPDQVNCELVDTVGLLYDKAVGASDRSDVRLPRKAYISPRGGLRTVEFSGNQYGITRNSRIDNMNHTWSFVARVGDIENVKDGILAYGNEPSEGTFEYSVGDVYASGNLKITKRGLGRVGFVPVVKGTKFKIIAKGGRLHGGGLIWEEEGQRRWIWKWYEDVDENGLVSPTPIFYVGDRFGNRRKNSSGDYQGGWSLPYGNFDSLDDFNEDVWIHFLQTDTVGRQQGAGAVEEVDTNANNNYNVYSVEFDRELYLLNFYVNGVNTVQQEFSKTALLRNQKIGIFSDLTNSLTAQGNFAELLVVPYIDQETRKGVESYLSNKWSIPISNEQSVVPNFQGPISPIGRSNVANYYPPVLEDRPSPAAVFLMDEGAVAGGPSGGIWLEPDGPSMLPNVPGFENWSSTPSDPNGVLYYHHDSKTTIFFRTYAREDMVARVLAVQYYRKVPSTHADQPPYEVACHVIGWGWGYTTNNYVARQEALLLSGFRFGTPNYRRFYPVDWAQSPYDVSKVTHKISGFGDYRDGYYARYEETGYANQGAYLWLEHNAVAYNAMTYPTFKLYDGTWEKQYYVYGVHGSSQYFVRDFVEDGKAFYRYRKLADLNCSAPTQESYIYPVVEIMDDNVNVVNRKLVFSSTLGARSGDDFGINHNEMDLIDDDGNAIDLGANIVIEEASNVCLGSAPIQPLIRIEDDDDLYTYNPSVVNGDLILEEVNGDHFRKSYNGNICIISQKYQSGEEPDSLDDNGLRGFYNILMDRVEYHKRGKTDRDFEGTIIRLVSEPVEPANVMAGIYVNEVTDVDAFVIADDVSNVYAELDYEYELHDTISYPNDRADLNGWVDISDDQLRMVTSYGLIYKRDDYWKKWDYVTTIQLQTSNVLGYYANSGLKISGDGNYILTSQLYGNTTQKVEVWFWDTDDTVQKISEIPNPHPSNSNFSNYFGRSADINKDGSFIITGTSYTSGVEGTSDFEGMFHLWQRQSNGTYALANIDKENLRGRDFGMTGGFTRDTMRYGVEFAPNGKALILANQSGVVERKIVPHLYYDEDNDIWREAQSLSTNNFGFGMGVALKNNYGAILESNSNSIQTFIHWLPDATQVKAKQTVSARSGYSLGNFSLQKDGAVALQSGFNNFNWDGSYRPSPVEISVFYPRYNDVNLPPRRVVRKIKNNYYFNANNYGRVASTSDYTFVGPMTLGGAYKNHQYSELYVFAEGNLNHMRIDTATF